MVGARLVVAESGVRQLTMSAVAERGGVAKATIYNHFRSRGELLDGLLVDELATLGTVAAEAGDDVVDQLTAVARSLNTNPVVAGVRRHEPDVLLAMASAATRRGRDDRADAIVDLLAERLSAHGADASPAALDLLVRWFCSLTWSPLPDEILDAEAVRVAAALTRVDEHVR